MSKPRFTPHYASTYSLAVLLVGALASACASPAVEVPAEIEAQSDALMTLPAGLFTAATPLSFGATVMVTTGDSRYVDGGLRRFAVAKFDARKGDKPTIRVVGRKAALPVAYLVQYKGGSYVVLEGSVQPTTTGDISFGRSTLSEDGEYFVAVTEQGRNAARFDVTLSNRVVTPPPPPAEPVVRCNAPPMSVDEASELIAQGSAERELPLNALLQTQRRTCHTVTGCSAWQSHRVDFYDGTNGQLLVTRDGDLQLRTGTSVINGASPLLRSEGGQAKATLSFGVGSRHSWSGNGQVSNAGLAVPRTARFFQGCIDVEGTPVAEAADEGGTWTEYRATPARIQVAKLPRTAVDDTPPAALACSGAPATNRSVIARFARGANSLDTRGTRTVYARNCTSLTGCTPWATSSEAKSYSLSVDAMGKLALSTDGSPYLSPRLEASLTVDNGELYGEGSILPARSGATHEVSMAQSIVSERCLGYITTTTSSDGTDARWTEQAIGYDASY